MPELQSRKLAFEVDAASHKQKLGDYLFDNLRDLSKMYLRALVRDGKCEVNGAHVNSGYRLRQRDFIEIDADLSRGTANRPEDISLDIVFEDAELIVVNKSAGLLVHPSHRDKSGTLLTALAFHLNKATGAQTSLPAISETAFGLPDYANRAETASESKSDSPRAGKMPALQSFIRPGLIHRLDKQTSGLIVVAKTARAHRIISGHFLRKRVEKLYLALVEGVVESDEGSMNAPIGRFAELKYWGVKDGGKLSETKFRVRERFADTTLLELEPVTGRTNQLRIHCEMIGHPIVGDTARGGHEFERLCLHAYRLAFPHPSDGERMEFQSEIPADFAL